MWADLLGYANSMQNPWLKKLVLQIVADPGTAKCFKRAPAAKVMHHAYIGGLLEHVIGLCGMAKLVAGHYPELDADLLMTVAILHDVGKLEELCYERAIGYTTPGQLLGHIVMEFETVTRAMDKIEGFPAPLKTVVQHLLISHHGQYEFGSPKLPMIREAMVFHYLDDLDSKMAAVRVALATPSGDDEWSSYSGALGRKFLKLDAFLKSATPAPDLDSHTNRTRTTHPASRQRARTEVVGAGLAPPGVNAFSSVFVATPPIATSASSASSRSRANTSRSTSDKESWSPEPIP